MSYKSYMSYMRVGGFSPRLHESPSIRVGSRHGNVTHVTDVTAIINNKLLLQYCEALEC